MSNDSVPTASENESSSQEKPPPSGGSVSASDSGEVGKALESASPQDDLATAAKEGTLSAGEAGRAVGADVSSTGESDVEVVIGEIPDADDISVMRWTARCSYREHHLLGYFDSEEAAIHAKEKHLASQH